MHHALYIEEILNNIFSHCHIEVKLWGSLLEHRQYANQDLAAIARTCRTFKDLALDMIWAELPDLSPFVRCLPHISTVDSRGLHSFRRQLENAEWETLRSYTSRVRTITELYVTSCLAIDCIDQLSNPPDSAVPFFPKFHRLCVSEISTYLYPFVLRHFAGPQLEELSATIPNNIESIFHDLGNFCPNVRYFSAMECRVHVKLISDIVCHWSNIQSITCPDVVLDFTALSHLATKTAVTSLAFTVDDTLIDQFMDTPSLSFSTLSRLSVDSRSQAPLWRMFHCFDLPVIHSVSLSLLHVHPTPVDSLAVVTALAEACSHESLNELSIRMFESRIPGTEYLPPCQLNFELLHPLTVFHNLQSLSLDVDWDVDLMESQLLRLASSWTRLRKLRVAECGNWKPSSGITPEGFIQLLERCRSLQVLSVILNTQGYTEAPCGHPWRGRTMPRHTIIHLLDSTIEEDAIEALGVFFHVAPYPSFRLSTRWDDYTFRGKRLYTLSFYGSRWARVRDIAKDLSESRRKLLQSIRAHAAQCGSADD